MQIMLMQRLIPTLSIIMPVLVYVGSFPGGPNQNSPSVCVCVVRMHPDMYCVYVYIYIYI